MAKLLCTTWNTLGVLSAAVAGDKNKRISLKERFQAYDKSNSGFVSLETFMVVMTRELQRLVTMSHEEAMDLSEYFKIADNRINYKHLCDVIDISVVKLKGKPKTVIERMSINKLTEYEEKRVALLLNCIAEKLRTFKVIPGLNIKKGEGVKSIISNAEFGKVLNFLGICLTPVEFHLLSKKFATDPFYISYKGFLHSVGEILERKHVEADGNAGYGNGWQSHFENMRDSQRTVSDVLSDGQNEEKTCCGKANKLECIMDRIRLRLKFRRICLRAHFRDWDKQNNGRILKRHFWNVFRDAGFFFTFDEISMLEACYFTEHGMDYLSFLQDLNIDQFAPMQVRSDPKKPEGSDCGPFRKDGLGICCGKYEEPDSAIFMVKKRKIACKAFNKIAKCPHLNLSDVFKDQDKCNVGCVTKEQLLKALGRRNMDNLLSPTELRELSNELKNKKGLVNYRTLETALNLANPYVI